MIAKSPILRAWLVHIGFHTGWVLLYLISLLGFFLLIPLIGTYNAFVLGFLGMPVLASTTSAALLGYIVFSVTGLLSGWLISRFRLKSVWLPEFLSLAISCVLLVGATFARYSFFGVAGIETILPLPITTGRADADEMGMALKAAYHSAGEVPPHFDTKPSVLPLEEVQPSLPLLEKGFRLAGGPYVFCNLPPVVWKELRKAADSAKYPVLWSTKSDTAGTHMVISVDLKTDIFHDKLIGREEIEQRLSRLETAIQGFVGDTNFKLPK